MSGRFPDCHGFGLRMRRCASSERIFWSDASAIGNWPHFWRRRFTSADIWKNLDCSSHGREVLQAEAGMKVLFM